MTKAVPSGFQHTGDAVVKVYPKISFAGLDEAQRKQWSIDYKFNRDRTLGSSAFAQTCFGTVWGLPPSLCLDEERNLQRFLQEVSQEGLISSASDIADGGTAVAIARSAFANGVGFNGEVPGGHLLEDQTDMFVELPSAALITCRPEAVQRIRELAHERSLWATKIGRTGGSRLQIAVSGGIEIDESLEHLRKCFSEAFEEELAAQVVLA